MEYGDNMAFQPMHQRFVGDEDRYLIEKKFRFLRHRMEPDSNCWATVGVGRIRAGLPNTPVCQGAVALNNCPYELRLVEECAEYNC